LLIAVCVPLHIKINNGTLIAENAAPTVTDKSSTLNSNTDVFLRGSAMQIEYRDNILRRDTSVLLH
jgi:hypothetical protein